MIIIFGNLAGHKACGCHDKNHYLIDIQFHTIKNFYISLYTGNLKSMNSYQNLKPIPILPPIQLDPTADSAKKNTFVPAVRPIGAS